MSEEIVEFESNENQDRFLVLFFNCIYFDCDFEKSWSLTARKIVFNEETQLKEFCYLVQIKSCCHSLSILTLWVNQTYLANSRTYKLIEKFEKNLIEHNLIEAHDPNIHESLEYCDSIVDELFNDSNNLKVSYEDYEWLMRKYDPAHEYFGQKNCVNINNLENMF